MSWFEYTYDEIHPPINHRENYVKQDNVIFPTIFLRKHLLEKSIQERFVIRRFRECGDYQYYCEVSE